MNVKPMFRPFSALGMLVTVLAMSGSACSSPPQEYNAKAQTLLTYLELKKIVDGEVRFEYFGGPLPGILTPVELPPAPFVATYRGILAPKEFVRLWNCWIKPHDIPEKFDLHRRTGSVTILIEENKLKDVRARRVEIVFFQAQSVVWFDGRLWDIDDDFWDWMDDSYPFSGIDLGRHDRKEKKAGMPPPQVPQPIHPDTPPRDTSPDGIKP